MIMKRYFFGVRGSLVATEASSALRCRKLDARASGRRSDPIAKAHRLPDAGALAQLRVIAPDIHKPTNDLSRDAGLKYHHATSFNMFVTIIPRHGTVLHSTRLTPAFRGLKIRASNAGLAFITLFMARMFIRGCRRRRGKTSDRSVVGMLPLPDLALADLVAHQE